MRPSPSPPEKQDTTIEARGVIVSANLATRYDVQKVGRAEDTAKPLFPEIATSIRLLKGEKYEGTVEVILPPELMDAVYSAFMEGRFVRVSLTF